MGPREPLTLQALVDGLPSFGSRRAVGLREDLGLRWWTYDRLHRATYHAAALLRDAGVGKGDHVVFRGRNSPEWVAFFLGAVVRGAVVVPVDFDSRPEFITRVCSIVHPKACVSSEAFADGPACVDPNALDTEARASTADVVVPVTPSDPVIVFFTSGTTSEPRGVVLTHANVVAQIAHFRRWRVIARSIGGRMLVMAPFSHAQGLVLGVAIPLSLGLSVIYTHSSSPGHLIRLLRDNRVPLLSTVPRVLHVLHRTFLSQVYGKGPDTLAGKLLNVRARSVRRHYVFTHMRRVVGYKGLWVVLVGGAPLPACDEDFWRVSGCLVAQGYGLTETTAIVSVNSPVLGKFGCVGKPLGDQELRLAEDGEILVRGANVAGRYLGKSDCASSVHGFLRTGDIGRIDRRNRLFVLGRTKDVIVTGEGFNVHASDVEAVLSIVPEVEDSVVLGHERDGHTEVHAALLLRPAGNAVDVVGRANQQLLPYQRIRSWSVWPESDFPRSALMKPRRQEIADRISASVAAGDPAAGSELQSLDLILSIEDRQKRVAALARYIARTNGTVTGQKVGLVKDAGLGSLDVIELLALLENHSGQMLDRIAIDDDVTVSDLQALIRNPGERKLRPFYARDAPRWAELPFMPAIRRVFNPAVLDTLVHLRARLVVSGTDNLAGLELPAIFAGGGHEHGFDVPLIYSALPRHLRRRLAIVMHRWVLTEALEPRPHSTLGARMLVSLGFHVVVPLFFPFVLSSQYTRSRDALTEACRLIDRGYSLIAFEGPGLGVTARQCGIPIVPVRIDNPEPADFRLRARRAEVAIHFERPIRTSAASSDSELARTLREFFERNDRRDRGPRLQ